MAISGNQLKAARALAEVDQQELADRAGVGVNTIRNMEASGAANIRARTDTLDAVVEALSALEVEFTSGAHLGVKISDRKAALIAARTFIIAHCNKKKSSEQDASEDELRNIARHLELARSWIEIDENLWALDQKKLKLPDDIVSRLKQLFGSNGTGRPSPRPRG
jgi:transcriptional regulator with XRE-family HTH domain